MGWVAHRKTSHKIAPNPRVTSLSLAHLARTVPSASTRASIQLAEAHPITRIPLVRSSGARNLFDPSPPVTFDSTINALTRSATDAPDSRTRRAAASARRFRFVVSASVTARIARDIARVSDARDRARSRRDALPRSRARDARGVIETAAMARGAIDAFGRLSSRRRPGNANATRETVERGRRLASSRARGQTADERDVRARAEG